MDFRTFLENADNDLEQTLKKIPPQHRELAHKYHFKFQPHNTLKGDNQHIGVTDNKKKIVTIAAPWFYGREMTTLHEIGHLVWQELSKVQRKKWEKIVKKTKMEKKHRQNPEELFCMAYGATYSKHPPLTYCHKTWQNFIKQIS